MLEDRRTSGNCLPETSSQLTNFNRIFASQCQLDINVVKQILPDIKAREQLFLDFRPTLKLDPDQYWETCFFIFKSHCPM